MEKKEYEYKFLLINFNEYYNLTSFTLNINTRLLDIMIPSHYL